MGCLLQKEKKASNLWRLKKGQGPEKPKDLVNDYELRRIKMG